MKFDKRLIFSLVTLAGTLITLEILLQIACLIFPKQTYPLWPNPVIQDQRLGYRPNPAHPEHDQRGFRNKFVPVAADIVALGDSQTYGVDVSLDRAWPHQLADLAKLQVYSMAYGGYGPVHSLFLFEEAKKLHPRLIIETFYAGNDLYDSYSIVYDRQQYVELKSTEEKILSAIQTLEHEKR